MPRAAQMVKQACDACRRRKVKCNAQRPCSQCRSAGLNCQTSLVRQKKGRQGRTANVLTELRTQLAGDNNNEPSSPADAHQTVGGGNGRCHFTRSEHLLSRELLRDCSEYFFARMQGTVPILHEETFQRYVDQMDTCVHAYCLVASFGAFVMMQTGYSSCRPGEQWAKSMVNGRALLEEATEARRHLDPLTIPVRSSITIAFLLYGCHIALGNQRHAYYFLREATTLYTAGMLDSQSGALEGDGEHPSMSGKLFWLLVISERAHAIRRHRPVTLQITASSPSLDEPSALDAASIGFRCLADLYRPFDESFLGLWNGTHTTCSPEGLIQLDEHIRNAVPADLELPDILMADLRVSQQWLRTMIWQLSTTAGFLSSKATHPCMEFRYPLEIARDLSMATWKLSPQSMETHGIGLIEKIFEVACTLTDVMACLSTAGLRSSAFRLGPQDYLKHFFSLVHNLPGGRQRFLPLLLTKIGQTLPSMLQPITQHLNLPATATDPPPSSDKASEVYADLWPDDQSYSDFNYAEMSRIGDKTPEIDEAFMQYLNSKS
ncbi:Zn(II)2Cys6 transcription factor [Aspergillus clavatus NRRL 1]|uniref:C6 finger domain protein, putative n=1 Tax=Aspergillus clavatus (strain ATCC 1007 / CBS 513.65 / DSM 816 / NCTC 3887 / NRRL 1 / QM 1276 / 107) TaxID=344612 RepID=A1C4J9_ASPCL|nr:C6 finger domain protein, putative [Aspergillus clavatus NRRL 1]EAW15339.1 C6 finger domain protein, putative [Aspergillus clavatus NRRL 1]